MRRKVVCLYLQLINNNNNFKVQIVYKLFMSIFIPPGWTFSKKVKKVQKKSKQQKNQNNNTNLLNFIFFINNNNNECKQRNTRNPPFLSNSKTIH